jgi:hypothetical protein
MLTVIECPGNICKICYVSPSNLTCNRCSFVLCNSCLDKIKKFKVLNKCSQCNLEGDWAKTFTGTEFYVNPFETELPLEVRTENAVGQLCKTVLKKFGFFSLGLVTIFIIGLISSLLMGTYSTIIQRSLVSQFFLFMISGLIFGLFIFGILLVVGICFVNCILLGVSKN